MFVLSPYEQYRNELNFHCTKPKTKQKMKMKMLIQTKTKKTYTITNPIKTTINNKKQPRTMSIELYTMITSLQRTHSKTCNETIEQKKK